MIGIIHSNWDSDLVLGEGELEKIIQGEILSGEIANYNEICEVFLSINEDEFATPLYLDWNKENPGKYNFKIISSELERFRDKNYINGRYENGLDGSKLTIYGHQKNNLIKEDIEFAIQMIKLKEEAN